MGMRLNDDILILTDNTEVAAMFLSVLFLSPGV
jgi:hypothetical protein